MPKESRAFLAAIALFALCTGWVFFGMPVTAAEWQGLPSQFQMSFQLLPARAVRVLKLFHTQATMEKQMMKLYDDALVSLPLEDYLVGVLAEEMPASYHMEALKAQAVAARTRLRTGCDKHPEADACADYAHCQGYLGNAGQQAKWGAEYAVYHARLQKAVSDTAGEIITYEGTPITVLYHAVSGGFTEDAKAVFGGEVPYLKGVESKGEEGVSKFETTQSFTNANAAALLNAAFPNAHLSAEWLPIQLMPLSFSDSGRVALLQLGDTVITGRELRQALNLNSTLFSVQFTDSNVAFSQKGYGHGVGMSQAGANAMAAKGHTYAAILSHYFQGTALLNQNETAAFGDAEYDASQKEDFHDELEGKASAVT